MDMAEAASDIRHVLEQERGGQYIEVVPGMTTWVTSDGVFAQASPSDVKFGFGVRSEVTPSVGLLQEIDQQCRLNVIGHLWLAAGSTNDHWSVMWGVKLLYGWCGEMSVAQALFDCLANRQALLNMMGTKLAPYGGRDYWSSMYSAGANDAALGAAGLVLTGHLA